MTRPAGDVTLAAVRGRRGVGRSALRPDLAVEEPVLIADAAMTTPYDPADPLGEVVRAALRAHQARRQIGEVIA
jgi:hypothetical protein